MNGSDRVQYKRSLEDLINLRRSMWHSYIRAAQLRNFSWRDAKKPFYHQARIFFNTMLWVLIYLKHRIGIRHRFPDNSRDRSRGVYDLMAGFPLNGERHSNDEIRVSLAADWASGTPESHAVACRIREFNPHYTIHLGDIYFVGSRKEVKESCLGNANGKNIHGVAWPIGSCGGFALNGNHEMYANGRGYFKTFLPHLGMRPAPGAPPQGQRASFFALENDHWIIVAVDTGYNSVGVPILERTFLIKKIPYVGGDCGIPSPLVRWLRQVIKPRLAGKGLILLSHHQYDSGFENGYPKAGVQFAEFLDRPALWFWGNEHRMAVYGLCRRKNGIEAYGRCIGHGGMPVLIHQRPRCKPGEGPLVIYDDREYRRVSGVPSGYNGYANLTFRGQRLSIEYRDLRQKDNLLLTEEWEVSEGALTGKGIRVRTSSPDFRQHHPDLRSAIQPANQPELARLPIA